MFWFARNLGEDVSRQNRKNIGQREAGQDGCMTGGIRNRRDAGK